MNPFRTSQKIQAIRPQNPYESNLACGVCLQNTYDYSPFGVSLDGRTMESDFYRRGFNGMEKDDEFKGKGNSYSTEFRQLDVRLGRWYCTDPKDGHPNLIGRSPYHFSYNNPILYTDEKGDIPWPQLVAKYTSIGGLAKARTINQLRNKAKPHHGLDMAAPMGTPIYAAAGGKVIHAGPCSGYGNAIIIDHGNGFVTLYGHMRKSDIQVQKDEIVKNGQEISKVGNEGRSTGPHLHVEYIYNFDGSNQTFWSKKGEKNKHVFDPRSINDLQDVIDRKEDFKGEFLDTDGKGPKGSESNPINKKEVIVIVKSKPRPYSEEDNKNSNPFKNGPTKLSS
jgi:RHS repeat-associated protein